MRACNHHMELGPNGEGKCSRPMWCQGVPDGFCDRPAFGKQVVDKGYCPGLACSIHGGPVEGQVKPHLFQIRFDGPPSHESGRFVEVERADGSSFSLGKWLQDGDTWLLKVGEEELRGLLEVKS